MGRANACPDIWRGLLVLLGPNGILLMPPTQQRPEQFRRRTVAYIATEFDGCIIGFTVGFAYTTVDLGGRLAVHTENNRVYFNGRLLHIPYREAPFGIRSWLVVFGLDLLRLNAHSDIWRSLSVPNGILLMSPIQQRPKQLRWRAVAYTTPEFDDGIIVFTVGFANATINLGGRRIARNLGMSRLNTHPDIRRGLSVPLVPNGILLMSPMQHPRQFRRRAVAYIAPEFDGCIIGFTVGFAYTTVDLGGRLAVHTENNRVYFNGRLLHIPYREAPFGIRSWLVVFSLDLLQPNAHPDIWRGLSVPNGILLMLPIQQCPGQFRRYAVTYIAPEFDGCIIGSVIGFVYAAVDPGRRLVEHAEDNRVCFNDRPLHAPYREAPFSVRSCLVVLSLGLLRLNAHSDIWRGLLVLLESNGILLMPPTQQRPEQLRRRAVAYVATEFDDGIIGFVFGFANATITPGGRRVARDLTVLRLNARPDIWRSLSVPNGILLMPSTQQRPGQFRQRAVAYIAPKFDDGIIGFTVGFANATITLGDWLAARDLGVVSLNTYPDIWRSLSVPNGILLMPSTQQRPGQFRQRAVAYIAPKFDDGIIGFVIGFANATIDPGGRLDARDLSVLRLNARPDIWRSLSVLNGILLMSSIQQRPEQLRRRAVAYVATEFDDGIIGFAISFANAAINPGGRRVARDLGVLRFAHPDIWRGLPVLREPNGILLIPPTQQRPEQLRWHVVCLHCPKFDDFLVGFIIGFADATITPSGRLVVRNLGVVRHTYPDIRRGLLVSDGILLMPPIQQRPGKFRQHAYADIAPGGRLLTHRPTTHPRP